jgi:hypothetical protein
VRLKNSQASIAHGLECYFSARRDGSTDLDFVSLAGEFDTSHSRDRSACIENRFMLDDARLVPTSVL